MLLGALAFLLLLVGLLDFRPIQRFNDVLAFHTAWKGGVPTKLWRKVSLVEFGLYASGPLMLSVVAEVLRSTRDLYQRKR
ncbi:MAG TPA: hypothetical protein VI299_27150, partial [Polyangiales bacterium]